MSNTSSPVGVKNRQWEYSSKLRKLYSNMDHWVQVDFRIGANPPNNLSIRTLPIFSDAAFSREPVKRCPNHTSFSDPSNAEFGHPSHLIRYQHEDARYHEDVESGRLSVVFNTGTPHQGTDVCTRLLKFMCLGSCVGGLNRRQIKLVFTLEQQGVVVGRKVVDVRICSCPRRDLQQEEARAAQKEEQCRRITEKFAATVAIPVAIAPGRSARWRRNRSS